MTPMTVIDVLRAGAILELAPGYRIRKHPDFDRVLAETPVDGPSTWAWRMTEEGLDAAIANVANVARANGYEVALPVRCSAQEGARHA